MWPELDVLLSTTTNWQQWHNYVLNLSCDPFRQSETSFSSFHGKWPNPPLSGCLIEVWNNTNFGTLSIHKKKKTTATATKTSKRNRVNIQNNFAHACATLSCAFRRHCKTTTWDLAQSSPWEIGWVWHVLRPRGHLLRKATFCLCYIF